MRIITGALLRSAFLGVFAFLSTLPRHLPAQQPPPEARAAIDSWVADAYRSAAARFPCKVKAGGKAKMLQWQAVDRCLNEAAGLIDAAALAKNLAALRDRFPRSAAGTLLAWIDESFERQALPFDRVFSVKNEKALLTLTNSLLRFLPSESLMDLPVTDRSGTRIGLFGGTYSFERAGGLAAANSFRLALFQYRDPSGEMRTAPDKLLLDSFGVPWKDARNQRGFRLTAEILKLER